LPEDPTAGGDNSYFAPFTAGILRAKRDYGLETETIVVDEFGDAASRERALAQLRDGDFELVVWVGGNEAARAFLVGEVPTMADTRFAYIGSAIVGSDVEQSQNATALHFRDDQAGHLAGYPAGLTEDRRSSRETKARRVSAVGGFADHVPVRALIDGYTAGACQALPGVKVQVDYSNEFNTKTVCERIANRQIDDGSGGGLYTSRDMRSGRPLGGRDSRRLGNWSGRRSVLPR